MVPRRRPGGGLPGGQGLGLRQGILAEPAEAEAVKREGAGKSPAGLFRLAQIFDGNPQALPEWVAMPVIIAEASPVCVNDPASRYYNRVIDRDEATPVGWSSHENMLRSDELYDLGLTGAYAGGGSAHAPATAPGRTAGERPCPRRGERRRDLQVAPDGM